jgi:hypothetical protein
MLKLFVMTLCEIARCIIYCFSSLDAFCCSYTKVKMPLVVGEILAFNELLDSLRTT